MVSTPEVLIPIGTFILGSLSQIIGEGIRDRRRSRREDELRDRELLAQAEERRADSRRADLKSLGDLLRTFNKLAYSIPEDYSPGRAQAISNAKIQATILVESIGDDAIRSSIAAIVSTLDQVAGYDVAEESAREAWPIFERAHEDASMAVGKLIRQAA